MIIGVFLVHLSSMHFDTLLIERSHPFSPLDASTPCMINDLAFSD